MERKGKVKSGKLNNVVDKIRSKRRDKKDKSDVRNTTSYKIKKRLLALLKSLLLMVKSVTVLSIVITILVIIVVFLFIIILLVAMAGIIMIITGDNKGTSINLQSNATQTSTNSKPTTSTKADVDAWLNACDRAWKYLRKQGYNYVQACRSDKRYGTVRLDCSGYVYTCLKEAGFVKSPSSSAGPDTSTFVSEMKKIKGWTIIPFVYGRTKLKRGDIVLTDGHICVYAGGISYYNNSSSRNSFQTHKGKYDAQWEYDKMKDGSCRYLFRLTSSTTVTIKGTKIKELMYPDVGENKLIPFICQTDYSDVAMNKANGCPANYPTNIATSGCSFTAMAMIATYLTGKVWTPKDTLKRCGDAYHGYGFISSIGCNNSWWIKKLGLGKKYKLVLCKSSKQAMKYGKKLYPLFCSMGASSRFTSNCHYIVVRGITKKGECYVNDPSGGKEGYTNKQWLNKKFDFVRDVWNHKHAGIWAVVPK